VALATYCHPSQGIVASDKVGNNGAITYLYGPTQQVALAAQATNTTFDPRSLDLPSISSLVCFYHACLGFSVKQTRLDAIKAGDCDTFDGLTYFNAARYCPDANKTILGRLAQQRQNVKSPKIKPIAQQASPLLPAISPPEAISPSNKVFVQVHPLRKLYTEDTGQFPV
jgi:hypothetical protein